MIMYQGKITVDQEILNHYLNWTNSVSKRLILPKKIAGEFWKFTKRSLNVPAGDFHRRDSFPSAPWSIKSELFKFPMVIRYGHDAAGCVRKRPPIDTIRAEACASGWLQGQRRPRSEADYGSRISFPARQMFFFLRDRERGSRWGNRGYTGGVLGIEYLSFWSLWAGLLLHFERSCLIGLRRGGCSGLLDVGIFK